MQRHAFPRNAFANRLGQVLLAVATVVVLLFVEHLLNTRISALQPMRPALPAKVVDAGHATLRAPAPLARYASQAAFEAGSVRAAALRTHAGDAPMWVF